MENKELAIFENEKFGQIRSFLREGDPWFVAKDVCEILEIEWRGFDSIVPLDDDEKDVALISTPGGKQEMIIISESGLYVLIFKSRKKEARAIRKWITSEVIPSIRKTGKYVVGNPVTGKSLENIFDRVRPLDMLDAIYQYRQSGEIEKAHILAKNWERHFGFSAFDEESDPDEDSSACIDPAADNSKLIANPLSDKLLSPAKIGSFLSPQLTGKEVNKLLCKMNLQKKDHRGYIPTSKGAAYTTSRTPYAVNLRWKMEIIEVIKLFFQSQRVGNSFSL